MPDADSIGHANAPYAESRVARSHLLVPPWHAGCEKQPSRQAHYPQRRPALPIRYSHYRYSRAALIDASKVKADTDVRPTPRALPGRAGAGRNPAATKSDCRTGERYAGIPVA